MDRRYFAITAGVLLCAAFWAGTVPAAEEPIDVVFVTDDSPSMNRNDPGKSRRFLLRALCDFLLHPGGDRVAVLRLGGALETSDVGAVSFPFTEIPLLPDEKTKTLFNIKGTFDNPVAGFGRATDFNVLFESGVFPILRQRLDARRAVVIMVTDGAMNVIEGDRVSEEYRKALAALPGGASRAALTEVALSRFRRMVLPLLKESRTVVMPLAMDKSPAVRSVALAGLARLPGGPGRMIVLGEDPAEAMARVLAALARLLGYLPLSVPFSVEVEAGEEACHDMWIPIEASASRLLVMGDTEDFSLAFTDVSGSALGAEEGCSFFGQGERHRVISLGRQTIPNRILKISNRSGGPARFRVYAYSRFAFATRARVVNPKRTLCAGDAIRVEVSLVAGPTEAVVRDKWLVERTHIEIRIIDSAGERLEVSRKFSGLASAKKVVEIPLFPSAPGGVYVLQIESRISVGSADLSAGMVEDRVRVTAAKTVVQIFFEAKTGFPDSDVTIFGTVMSGKVESEGLAVRLAVAGREDDAVDVALGWDSLKRMFTGAVRFPYPGYFEVVPRTDDVLDLLPSVGGGVDIRPRTFAVLGADGLPIEGVTFSPDPDGTYMEQEIEVVANLAAGEVGSFTILPMLKSNLGDVSVELSSEGQILGKEPLTLRGDKPRRRIKVRLQAGSDSRTDGEIGTFQIQGRIGGTSIYLDKGIRAVPRTPVEFTAATLLKDRRVLVAAVALGAILFLGLAYWLMLPRFRSEYLVEIDPRTGEPGDGTLVKDMPRDGHSPRKVNGIPEVKNSLQFRLTGLRPIMGRSCLGVPLKPFIQFYVNGKIYLSSTPLHHGDYIRLRGARFVREYVYFDRAVSDEDWAEIHERICREKDLTAVAHEPETVIEEAPPTQEMAVETEAKAAVDTIFSEDGMTAQARDEAPSKPTERKMVTLEDFFGTDAADKVRVEEGHAPPPVEEEEEEEKPKEHAMDDQATVLEAFFGEKDEALAPEEPAIDEEPAEGDHTEVVAGLEPEGDRTEVVAGLEHEGEHTEVVSEPEYEGDHTEVVAGDLEVEDEVALFDDLDEDEYEEEEPSIIIEMPEGYGEDDEEDIELVRSEEGDASSDDELPADLRETKVDDDALGILEKAFDSAKPPTEAIELSNEEEEVEIIETLTDEILPLTESDQPTILETAFSNAPDPAGTDEQGPVVVIDDWELKKLRRKEKGRE
jgi:hypothetical protein